MNDEAEMAPGNLKTQLVPPLHSEPMTSLEERRFGELLIKEGLITEAQLQEALQFQEELKWYKPVGQILVEKKLITAGQLNFFLDRDAQTASSRRDPSEDGSHHQGTILHRARSPEENRTSLRRNASRSWLRHGRGPATSPRYAAQHPICRSGQVQHRSQSCQVDQQGLRQEEFAHPDR